MKIPRLATTERVGDSSPTSLALFSAVKVYCIQKADVLLLLLYLATAFGASWITDSLCFTFSDIISLDNAALLRWEMSTGT